MESDSKDIFLLNFLFIK